MSKVTRCRAEAKRLIQRSKAYLVIAVDADGLCRGIVDLNELSTRTPVAHKDFIELAAWTRQIVAGINSDILKYFNPEKINARRKQ